MSRMSQTPCPAPTTALDPSHRRISSLELFGDDTTTNIDYTRAIDQPLTAIKPRRRSMLLGPARKKTTAAPVTIFEDVAEEQDMIYERGPDCKVPGTEARLGNGSTLLGKPPAKRAQAMVGCGAEVGGYAMDCGRIESTGVGYEDRSTLGRPKVMTALRSGGPVGRPHLVATSNAAKLRMTNDHEAGHPTSIGTNNLASIGSTVRKPPRRQTIFVPEDTTVMSIHPGPRDNTSRIDDSFHLPSLAMSQHVQDDNHNRVPQQLRSVLGAPAVKNPWRRQSVFLPEDTTATKSQPEPAHHNNRIDDSFQLPTLPSRRYQPNRDDTIVLQKPLRKPRQSLFAPPKRLPLRETLSRENNAAWDVAGANTGKENIPPAGHDFIEKGMKCLGISDPPDAQPRRQSIPPRVRSSLYAPTQSSQHRQTIVPRLQAPTFTAQPKPPRRTVPSQEPVPQARSAKPAPVNRDDEVKKVRDFVASKRVEQQTARIGQYPVLEGELSEPALYEEKWLSYREIALSEVVNGIFDAISRDVNLPASPVETSLVDQLISLYNRPHTTLLHDRLRASLEYGALACPQSSVSEHQPRRDRGLRQQLLDLWMESYNPKLLMAAAQVVAGLQVSSTPSDHPSNREFLKDFFVNVIDVDFPTHPAELELDSQRWRKTMLRSLMLVWLLDQAADARPTDGGHLLLQPASLRKSSAAILQTLGALMLPACGDIMRALKHLTYEVHYHQAPLDEMEYHVENMAIDFRDGFFLTRLVEALLYRDDQAIHNQRPLSQSLKLPASTPSHHLFNVQLALDALEPAGLARRDLSAQDIVHGHREKTVHLLWSLIGAYDGLSYLVDWDVLREDIHLNRRLDDAISTTRSGSFEQQESLLLMWAAAYASAPPPPPPSSSSYSAPLPPPSSSSSPPPPPPSLDVDVDVEVDVEVDVNVDVEVDVDVDVEVDVDVDVGRGWIYIKPGEVYTAILNMFLGSQEGGGALEGLLQPSKCLGLFSNAFRAGLVGSVGVVVGRETVICFLAVLAGRLLSLRREGMK